MSTLKTFALAFFLICVGSLNSSCANLEIVTPTPQPTAIGTRAAFLSPAPSSSTPTKQPTVLATNTIMPTPTGTATLTAAPTLTPRPRTPPRITPIPTQVPKADFFNADSYDDLLMIPPIAQAIDAWDVWTENDKPNSGINQVRMVDDPQKQRVVELSRTNSGKDKGGAGLVLPLDVDVSKYSNLYFGAWLKINYEESEYLAGMQPPGSSPEGGFLVRIRYLDLKGMDREWNKVFWTHRSAGQSDGISTLVKTGEWYNYASRNMIGEEIPLDQRPQRITEIKLYGYGWEFVSQVAEVRLNGGPSEPALVSLNIDACTLLTADELKTYLGESISILGGPLNKASCWYGEPVPGDLPFLNGLELGVGKINPKKIADMPTWVERLAKSVGLESVAGLGDQAFAPSDLMNGNLLMARQKDHFFYISVTQSRVKTGSPVEALKRLAAIVLARLPQ